MSSDGNYTSRPESKPKAGERRILIVKLSSLGDLFHALPAVHLIRTFAGAAVDWVTQEEYADIVRCFPDVDRVIAFPRRGSVGDYIRFLRSLRERRYDLCIDFQGLLKSAIPARLARARRRIGPSWHRECARLFYSSIAGVRNKNRHAVDEAIEVAKDVGAEEDPPVFPVRFPRVSRSEAGVRIALVPFSRWPTKNWPTEHFARFARNLNARFPCAFYLLGGPEDAAAGAALEKAMAELSTVSCFGRRLTEAGSLIQEMDLVVSVDSGPLHMAAALGIPTLSIFGPTDPARTGPYGEGHRVLGVEGLPCRPCFSRTCLRGDHACMARLYPSQLVEAAADLLRFVPRDRLVGA